VKLSFLLYLILLLIDGLVAWQATGSPMLLVFPFVGIVFYGALCGRAGGISEIVRIFISGFMITFGLLNFGNHLGVIFLTLLSLPQFLAATQCVWEMQHAGRETTGRGREMRVSVFSMAFYSAWGVAFILLQAENLRLAWLHQQLLAGTVFVLSLAAWESSRILRLKVGTTPDRLSRGVFWRRTALVLGTAALAILAFSALLPPVADAICQLSPKWKPPMLDANVGPPHRPKTPPNEDLTEDGTGSAPQQNADESARTGRMRLPKRVNLNQTEIARAYVQFDSKEQAEAQQQQGPMYLRSLALSAYDNNEWLPSSQDGFWTKDDEDGKKDGRVTINKDTTQSIHYTIYSPQADGNAMLALPNLQLVEAPKVYVLPDAWYQIQDTGNIRYGARSEPKIWDRLPTQKLKAANPGIGYLKVPEGRLGEELKRLKDQIFKFQQSPQECIPALQQFFRNQYTYSTKVENKNNMSPLENFLIDERKGYCDLFATSAALLLRKVGIPTRLGFGYMAGDYDAKTGLTTFRQLHAHSWVEIMLEGEGWVICEFTPRVDSTPGEGTSQQVATAPNLDSFNDVNTPPPATADQAQLEAPSFLAQLGQLWPVLTDPNVRIILGVAALALALFTWWKRYAARKSPEEKARRAAAARDQQPAYIKQLRELATAAGCTFTLGDTVREIHRNLKASGCDDPKLAALTKYHYAVRYEDAPQDRRRESEFLAFLKSFRQTWLQEHPPVKARG
jgi:hypothetical protein